MFPFSSKSQVSANTTAVVTGAGSGIGREFAFALAARGGEVLCADINLKSARKTVKQIKSRGGKAIAAQCDVREVAEVEGLAAIAEAKMAAPVNLVVNNAGIGVGGTEIGEVSLEDWHATLDVNLWGVIHGCHVFAPLLKAHGKGGIINVASTASFSAAPFMGPYNASKAAVLAISETLAAEFAGTPLRVTALCPTGVKTNIIKDGRIESGIDDLASKLIEYTGRNPAAVVKDCLRAYDRSDLYVMPQIEAKAIWRAKRYFPNAYAQAAGSIKRARDRFGATPNRDEQQADLTVVRKRA